MLLEADSTTFLLSLSFSFLSFKWWWWVGNKSNLLLNDREAFFALYYFHYKISHKLVHHFLIHWYIFPPWYCNERGKKLEAEEVICSHVCNFMIHDLIVIADVAQFFLQYNNPRCCYNAANSLNLAVRQSRKTIIWKKEQVGEMPMPRRRPKLGCVLASRSNAYHFSKAESSSSSKSMHNTLLC